MHSENAPPPPKPHQTSGGFCVSMFSLLSHLCCFLPWLCFSPSVFLTSRSLKATHPVRPPACAYIYIYTHIHVSTYVPQACERACVFFVRADPKEKLQAYHSFHTVSCPLQVSLRLGFYIWRSMGREILSTLCLRTRLCFLGLGSGKS